MKFILPAVLCFFLLIGAMAMPKRAFRKLDQLTQCGYQVQNVYRWDTGNYSDICYNLSPNGDTNSLVGYTYKGIQFQTLVTQQAGTVPLNRFYHSTRGNAYTTEDANTSKAAIKLMRSGYTFQGNIGYIFSFQATGAVALQNYNNLVFNSNIMTIHPQNEDLTVSNEWWNSGVIGYAFDPNGSTDC